MSAVAKMGIAVAGAAVILICLLAWIGGELHYRNCLASADLRYPVAYQQGKPGSGSYGKYAKAFGGEGSLVFYEKAQRDRAISSCSRWP
jgi:hypothetical protein